MTKTDAISDSRIGWTLWLAGMCGVVAVTLQVLPQMLRDAPELPMPVWALYSVSTLQSGVLLGVMVLIGLKLGPACALGAPLLRDRTAWPAGRLARKLAPAVGVGLVAGVVLALLPVIAPAELVTLEGKVSLPLLSRLLYGGITEELLVRWGLMTLIFWLLLRLSRWLPLRHGVIATLAIAASALVFGLAHLPAAHQFVGHLNREIVLHVVGVNFVFGCLFGWLFYRRGLEHAIVAHATTHPVAVAVAAL